MKYAVTAFLLTFALFFASSRYSLTRFDDADYIVDNPHVQGGLTRDNIRWALTNGGYQSNWHPLTWLSLMADVTAGRILSGGREGVGKVPIGYNSRTAHIMHFHNVVLHSLSAGLLTLLLIVVFRGRLDSVWTLLLALLWSVHPLRVEAVCWAIERKELLSVFFGLAAVACYLRSDDVRGSVSLVLYGLGILAFALGLAAKAVIVSVPVFLLAWDLAVVGRLRIRRLLPFVLLALVACLMTVLAQDEALQAGAKLSLTARLSTGLGGPLVYLGQSFLPVGLSCSYPATVRMNWPLVVGGSVLLMLMAAVIIRWLVRRDEFSGILCVIISWAYVGLVPMLGIVKVGADEHCDRFTYWAGCGAVVGLGLLMGWSKPRREGFLLRLGVDPAVDPWWKVRRLVLGSFVGVLVVLGYLSARRMTVWRDSVTLFRDALPKSWDASLAENLSCNLLLEYGREAEEEAEGWLRQCSMRNPCPLADLKLAKFLYSKQHTMSGWQGADYNPYAEEEDLVRAVLRACPENDEAKGLLVKILSAKGKLYDGSRK